MCGTSLRSYKKHWQRWVECRYEIIINFSHRQGRWGEWRNYFSEAATLEIISGIAAGPAMGMHLHWKYVPTISAQFVYYKCTSCMSYTPNLTMFVYFISFVYKCYCFVKAMIMRDCYPSRSVGLLCFIMWLMSMNGSLEFVHMNH